MTNHAKDDEAIVRAKWPDAELGYTRHGVEIVSKRKEIGLRWFEPKYWVLSDVFYVASEAWADAAHRIEAEKGTNND